MAQFLDKITGEKLPSGGVLALGNFDGVHLGHRAVLDAACCYAKEHKLPVYAMTFEPHPVLFFKKETQHFLLMPANEKRRRIRQAGIESLITMGFTEDLADLSPEEFISDVLIGQCRVRHVVIGFDFVFGHDRTGSYDLLRERLSLQGVGVTQVSACCDEEGEIISSTRIREALNAGEVKKAKRLLGRPFHLFGKIEHGDEQGRNLSYPTANIRPDPSLALPRYGVYAVFARRSGEEVWMPAVANFGICPTFDKKEAILEFHLLDFHGSFYGTEWEVAFIDFIRPEQKFSSAEALKEQIGKDVLTARDILKTNE